MKMQLKENVEFRNLTVNCNTFKEKVSELVEQFGGEKNFAKKSNVEEWEQIESYVNKNKVKIELYLRQNGVDLLTGEKININELENMKLIIFYQEVLEMIHLMIKC